MKDRKSQIIQVATGLIKKYGYDSFSYKDLSDAVGITKATLHHHFPKKEDLGLAVLQKIENQLSYLKEKTLEIKDAKERLDFIFKNMRGTLENDEICPISSMQAEFNVIPDILKDKISDISEYELNLIAQVLEEGRSNGSFHFEGESRERALIMLTSYKGALMYSRSFNTSVIDTVLTILTSNVE
jgi:TetR/AcrR family transcriptional repressor of nem operon